MGHYSTRWRLENAIFSWDWSSLALGPCGGLACAPRGRSEHRQELHGISRGQGWRRVGVELDDEIYARIGKDEKEATRNALRSNAQLRCGTFECQRPYPAIPRNHAIEADATACVLLRHGLACREQIWQQPQADLAVRARGDRGFTKQAGG